MYILKINSVPVRTDGSEFSNKNKIKSDTIKFKVLGQAFAKYSN
jgi:hypothetical protein